MENGRQANGERTREAKRTYGDKQNKDTIKR